MIQQPPLPDWLVSVHHDGSAKYVSTPQPQLGDTARLRLRLAHDAPVQRVYLRTFPDGEQAITPMQRANTQPPTQWWEVDLPITQPTVHYRFILQADDGVWFYTAVGPQAHPPLDKTDFRILANYTGPAWAPTAVFYQIFPDRFHNGDPRTDPQPADFEFRGRRPQTLPWGAPPPADAFNPFTFYGGDLPGVIQKLGYLADLGVNAIYLNPIFTAYTNHKYDVADYFHVDPHFGGDAALVALRQALDARQMRYLLDIVPNHCGYGHPWFQAAHQDANASEAEFFTFYEHPDSYAQWLMAWTLPKLNFSSVTLRRLIYEGDDAAFRHWLRPPFAADGWRVDVANMLGRQGAMQMNRTLAEGIYQAVKETRPDAYHIGENFFDATESLQDGGQWDGVMNYSGFSHPLLHWLRGLHLGAIGLAEPIVTAVPWPTAALAATWQQYLAAIPWGIALQQFNLLGSHDTPRIRTLLGENDALQRLAVTALMTFPGVPSIYYGDEIGLTDTPGLSQRACMPWDEAAWDQELLAFYRQMIHLRRETAVLQTGGFQILLVEADTIAYQRENEHEHALIIAHRGAQPRPASPLPVAPGGVANGRRFVEFFTGQEAVVVNGALPLPQLAQGVMLWFSQT